MGWMTWAQFPAGSGIFFSVITSITALGPTHPPIKWVPWALSLWLRSPGHKVDHSPSSSTKVKNVWSYTSTFSYIFMVWCLIKHRMSLWHGTYLSTVTEVLLAFTLPLQLNMCDQPLKPFQCHLNSFCPDGVWPVIVFPLCTVWIC
jgi:hypothetical protein